MKQKEVIDLIKLIDRTYNTDYAGDGDIVKDWFKVLKNYDFDDITNSLEYYMKNYTTYPPKVYELTKGYKTINDKKLLDGAYTRCLFCGKTIPIGDKHEDKCRSIEFIRNAVKRFKDQDIDKEKYYKMSDDEFNKYYISAVKLVVNNSTNELEVNMWKRYLENLNETI